MAYGQSELSFSPGLYANRSKRASKGRWVDGNLVRFRDGVPAQIGGWTVPPVRGGPVLGRPRAMHSWRPNSQAGRYAAIGTHTNVYQYDGGSLGDITPAPFVPGRADSIVGAGYGAAFYGDDLYGTPRTTSGNLLDAATWIFDMFGEVLIGAYTADGQIYRYQPGTDTRLVVLTNAPMARCFCVTDERHIIAFGCNGDPSLVMWCDRENPTVWTPLVTNRAGSYNATVSSPFQCSHKARGLVLSWTHTELLAMQALNNSLVYTRPERLADGCGAMGPHSVVIDADTAFWMGESSFWTFDGVVRRMPCELQDYVFKDLNLQQRAKFYAARNATFGEVWFYYCSSLSNEVDRAVIYSVETQTWSKAEIGRAAWCDKGTFPLPIAIDAAGVIYQHEDGDLANGATMPSYILSHPLTIGVGQQMMQILDFWPDMEPLSGPCDLTLIGRYYSGAPDEVFGPYTFTASTEKLDLSLEVRQVQVKISGRGSYWELGAPLLTIQPGSAR